MSDFTNKLSAPELIAEIAMDPPETDPKKIQEQQVVYRIIFSRK